MALISLSPAPAAAGRLRPIDLEPLPAPRWAVVLQRLALALGGLLVLAVTAMFLSLSILPRTGLYATYSVMSNSMEPAIPTGSMVVVVAADPASIRVGEVITVTSDQPPFATVTHRVTRIIPTPAGLQFKTKGDANSLEDPWQFGYRGAAGKVALTLPWLGYVLKYSGMLLARFILAGSIGLLVAGFFLPAIWRSTTGARHAGGA